MVMGRRRTLVAILGCVTILILWRNWASLAADNSRWAGTHISSPSPGQATPSSSPNDGTKGDGNKSTEESEDKDEDEDGEDTFLWRRIETIHPVDSLRPLPSGPTAWMPRVQASFGRETAAERETRLARQDVIRRAVARSWEAYRAHAWLHDELAPVSGDAKDPLGGWAATLVDSLDTLWIVGMKDEFELAVAAIDKKVSFEDTDAAGKEINVSEVNARFLGGLLAAHDLSGDERLLRKARDVGDMLYKAFDTPNRMPVTRWDVRAAAEGADQAALSSALVAEVGSLGMEFTRLSLVTGDPKYYDAVQRVADRLAEAQGDTRLPGLWPVVVDAAAANAPDFASSGADFSLGGTVGAAAYESLAKMVALLGGKDAAFAKMYTRSVDAALRHLVYRPMVPKGDDILFSGMAVAEEKDEEGVVKTTLRTSADHASCSVGGMLALGGKLIGNHSHVEAGAKLTQGCVWAYASTLSGVMPTTLDLTACPDVASPCAWNKTTWERAITARQRLTSGGAAASVLSRFNATRFAMDQNLPKGFAAMSNPRYALGPEAIESVFVLRRITGDAAWMDHAWDMWQSIDDLTRTDLAYGAVRTVNPRAGDEDEAAAGAMQEDEMPSVWMGATLKYFYLVFSEPGELSLDKWVFSTEGHPFKRLG